MSRCWGGQHPRPTTHTYIVGAAQASTPMTASQMLQTRVQASQIENLLLPKKMHSK